MVAAQSELFETPAGEQAASGRSPRREGEKRTAGTAAPEPGSGSAPEEHPENHPENHPEEHPEEQRLERGDERPVLDALRFAHERLQEMRTEKAPKGAGRPSQPHGAKAGGVQAGSAQTGDGGSADSTLGMRVERLLEEIRASRRTGEGGPGEGGSGGDASGPADGPADGPTARGKAARLMEEALQAIRKGTS
jgi:hypothetical protein